MIQELRFWNKTIMKQGFSLIELMVTVTIVMVLAGIGSYSINNFTQSRKVVTARDEVLSQIKSAKNLAITNQLPDKSSNLDYVRVSISGKTITVVALNNVGTVINTSPYFSKIMDIDGSVTISLFDNMTSITSFGFDGVTGRLLNSSGEFITGPVRVVLTDGTNSNSFRINDLGMISNDN